MNELALDPLAFIRPSPSGDTLGGVANRTRESLLLCEAFGFDYVLIETVGVGQSETTVSQMVDLFIMLLQPGAGDDLQGIKRGILEVVDMVVVTKDDGDERSKIAKARHDYEMALQILRHEGHIPKVLSCSALTKKGLPEVQAEIESYFKTHPDDILSKRKRQGLDWMWQLIHSGLKEAFLQEVGESELKAMEKKILDQEKTSPEAASSLLDKFLKKS
jgi:LAO/AO transport system kinase